MSTELVELRKFYAPPGFLLLARHDGAPAGCVGVRALTPSTGELRRLFVRPEHRTAGWGRQLLSQANGRARANRFKRLVLNTLPTMTAARSLYDADGYEPTDPYVADPVEGVEYLAVDLS
ncbi:MAG: GNAT family N-acetyltransferase [Nocardioides sp.]|nr:GNAT family N-acetyltransferase [Nocardioides sp.]